MGSFAVSCGISGISIDTDSKEKVKLLLLIPETDYLNIVDLKSEVVLKPDTNFVSGNKGPLGHYQPFCLPITGDYDTYGSLENIVRDQTVIGLEEYFQIPIEKILEIIQNSHREIFDPYSGILSAYGNGLDMGGYNQPTTTKWLEKAGFIKTGDKYNYPGVPTIKKHNPTTNKIEDTHEPIAYIEFKIMNTSKPKNEKEFVLVYWDFNTQKYKETWAYEIEKLCNYFYKYSKYDYFFNRTNGIMLGIKPEAVEKIILLRKLSGMFINDQVYHRMSDNIKHKQRLKTDYLNKYILTYLGFKFEYYVDEELKSIKLPSVLDCETDRIDNIKLVFSYEGILNHRFIVDNSESSRCVEIVSYQDNVLKKIKGKYTGDFWCFDITSLVEKSMEITGRTIDITPIEKVNPLQPLFDEIRDYYKILDQAQQEFDLEVNKPKENKNSKLLMHLHSIIKPSPDSSKTSEIFSYLNLFPLKKELYKKGIESSNPSVENDISNFFGFMRTAWATNRLFMPSAHFCSDMEEQMNFNNIVGDVLKEKIKKRKREYGE